MYDGATSEAFSRQRLAYQPNRYGDRWAPVLIAWVTRVQDPDLDVDVAGAGGSHSVDVPNGQRAYVTGKVELNAEKLARILRQPDGKHVVQTVVMHELGHVMGLAHVNSKSQLMYPEGQSGVTDFGAGDLTGLAALGKGACSSDR
jgi:predicted Zn-dependent protease